MRTSSATPTFLDDAGDRTTAEAASILDVPGGTVRSDLRRARMALANELEV